MENFKEGIQNWGETPNRLKKIDCDNDDETLRHAKETLITTINMLIDDTQMSEEEKFKLAKEQGVLGLYKAIKLCKKEVFDDLDNEEDKKYKILGKIVTDEGIPHEEKIQTVQMIDDIIRIQTEKNDEEDEKNNF